MPNIYYKLEDDIKLYYDNGYSQKRILWGLISNAHRVIHSVYIFKNFEEFCRQLSSDKQEDKKEIYWNGTYDEKLIDYIKIVVAFETFNKALLIKNNILIHKIDNKHNKKLQKKQQDGKPIFIQEFYEGNYSNLDVRRRTAELNGLTKNLSTINFSHTLNENYQAILKQDEDLVGYLKEINQKRNRLHLYSDFKGAFSVQHYITKWQFIMEKSQSLITNEMKIIDQELKNVWDSPYIRETSEKPMA